MDEKDVLIQKLKEQLERAERVNEGLRPYLCTDMKCERRMNHNICPRCGRVLSESTRAEADASATVAKPAR